MYLFFYLIEKEWVNLFSQIFLSISFIQTTVKKIIIVRWWPGIDGPPRPIALPETLGWATAGGLDIQPASGVGTGPGVGWKGYKNKVKLFQINTPKWSKLADKKSNTNGQIQTPCAPKGGKPPALGSGPSNGLFAGDGARAPFGCPHEWSTNKVLISGFGLGFLQSWCCQFKLHI